MMKEGLSELRKLRGFTQIDVAQRLGVDQTTVSKWENGEALPRADKLFDIADLYGVKVDDIYLARGNVNKEFLWQTEI
jgi:transcriptional regulator with XRE-family HTH domain